MSAPARLSGTLLQFYSSIGCVAFSRPTQTAVLAQHGRRTVAFGWRGLTVGETVTVREGDREAMSLLSEHVLEQGGNAIVVSADPDALDRFGRRLVQTLRQQSVGKDVQVSFLFEMSRDLLIERFNNRIAHLSVDIARQHGTALAAQVWVLHVLNDAQVSLGGLVARLVQDFPGAGVRVVVLAAPSAATALGAGFEGQRMLRCVVVAAGESALKAAPETVPIGDLRAESKPEADADPRTGRDETRALSVPPMDRRSAVGQINGRLIVYGVMALAFSALLVVFLLPRKPHRSPAPVAVIANPAPAEAEAEVPVAPVPEVTVPDAPVPESPLPDALVTGPAKEKDERVPAGGAQKSLREPELPADPLTRAVAEPPDVQARVPTVGRPAEGVEWARGLVRRQWLVQHVAVPTFEDARAWRSRNRGLSDARIVALARREAGEVYFVVISGPFVDRDTAARFAEEASLQPTFWIRDVASLQASLPVDRVRP